VERAMKTLLKRFWTGIVAALAAAAVALVVQMVGMMSLGWSIERITTVLGVPLAVGFTLGLLWPAKWS
jgi:hypothetical protein